LEPDQLCFSWRCRSCFFLARIGPIALVCRRGALQRRSRPFVRRPENTQAAALMCCVGRTWTQHRQGRHLRRPLAPAILPLSSFPKPANTEGTISWTSSCSNG
jgi:hypothetical protein